MDFQKDFEKILGSNVKQHLNKEQIILPGNWASELEIYAAAHLLKTNTWVYSRYGQWVPHMADCVKKGLSVKSAWSIYLHNNHKGTHFDVVIRTGPFSRSLKLDRKANQSRPDRIKSKDTPPNESLLSSEFISIGCVSTPSHHLKSVGTVSKGSSVRHNFISTDAISNSIIDRMFNTSTQVDRSGKKKKQQMYQSL